MSGKQLTHQQVKRYMNSRQLGDTQETAALKAGISVRTGRRIDKGEHKSPTQRTWRTREDPFIDIWDTQLAPLLEAEPSLTALTLWEWLDDNYPNRYPERLLRTLQRRVKEWRATRGPAKPVMFRQSVPPGHQGLSDFTHPDTSITIAGQPFKHLLYQFRLAFSGWRNVHIIQGGESYSALADGLQSSLQRLGAAPHEHRTDSLSAAYTTDAQKVQLTKSYNALCQHYQMRPTTNNTGVSHENGAIEAPHGTLKRRIKQQIALRLINYKHIIHSLAAKPQAFRFSQIRDDILPNVQYHQLWALAEQQFTPRDACKWIVSVLRIAYEYDFVKGH